MDSWMRWRWVRKQRDLAKIKSPDGLSFIDGEKKELPALELDDNWLRRKSNTKHESIQTKDIIETVQLENTIEGIETKDINQLPSLTPPEMPAVTDPNEVLPKEISINEDCDLPIAKTTKSSSLEIDDKIITQKTQENPKLVVKLKQKSAIDVFAKTLPARWTKENAQ